MRASNSNPGAHLSLSAAPNPKPSLLMTGMKTDWGSNERVAAEDLVPDAVADREAVVLEEDE